MQPVKTSILPLPILMSCFEHSCSCLKYHYSIIMFFHKMEDFKLALNLSAGVAQGIRSKVFRKSLTNTIIAPPNQFWIFRKSFIALSNASKNFLCAIAHLSHTLNLHYCKTFPIVEFFKMLHLQYQMKQELLQFHSISDCS